MSMKLMVAAMNCKVGNPGRKLVLLKLADNANDKGECWPSFQTIADHCEMGRSTVKMHIKTLEEAGFITVLERNGGASSNRFLLHLKKGEEIERHTRSKSDPADPVEIQPGQDSTRSESDPHPVKIQPPPGQNLTPEPVNEPVNEPKDSAVRVAHYLHERLVAEIPEIKANPKTWVTDIERAIRLDGRSEQDLISIIDWMHTDNKFWVPNIQSGKKLREKYNTMIAQKRQREASNDRPYQQTHNRPDRQSQHLNELKAL